MGVLQKSDTKRPAARPARGVLHRGGRAPVTHLRTAPARDLADVVEHFWAVQWNLAEPVEAQTLPHPSFHVLVEGKRHELAGVATKRFTRRLEGTGQVFGIKLRPGMSVALLDAPAAAFTDRVVKLGAVFGRAGRAYARELLALDSHDARVERAEAFVRALLRPVPGDALLVRDLIERAVMDRTLVKVDAWAAQASLPLRRFERLFRKYAGVRPKWVLQRYRLHEANERLKADPRTDLAGLALELGYVDQPHFARDFKAVVGVAPGSYARSVLSERSRGRSANPHHGKT